MASSVSQERFVSGYGFSHITNCTQLIGFSRCSVEAENAGAAKTDLKAVYLSLSSLCHLHRRNMELQEKPPKKPQARAALDVG
jgi:hypothetical protein